MGTIQAGATIETARIPELPLNDLPLDIGDKLPIYVAAADRTRQISLATLRSFLVNGSSQTITPQPVGSSIVVTAGENEANTKTFNVPALAGKTFILRRNFVGTLDIGVDYNCLSSGGFVLLGATDIISLGEKFELQLAVPTSNPNASGGGKIFDGEIPVSSNITLNQANHLRKIVRLRPTASGMLVKLAKVDEYPENEVVFIEAVINSPYETAIQTQAGQNIYFNGQSLQEIILRQGECLMLQCADSGWFVLYASPSLYETGELYFGYKLRSNEILCLGQELPRANYKRLWAWIQTLSNSLVDDDTWNTASVTMAGEVIDYPYRGCFSTGDGSTTFRLPDWSNMVPRVLNNPSGSDSQRYHNFPGGYQADSFKEHTHSLSVWGQKRGTGSAPDNEAVSKSQSSGFGNYGSWTIGNTGKSETRGKNLGVIAKICL